jgi:hypothetical protein
MSFAVKIGRDETALLKSNESIKVNIENITLAPKEKVKQ